MNRINIILVFLFCAVFSTVAQNDRDYIRRGNRFMRDSIFDKAQIEYQKAIEADNTNAMAHYNLGNALLYQNKAEDAMKEYEQAAKMETNKIRKAQVYHNMGVLLQSAKQIDKAVACYKESLRNNPAQDDTRYNYVLCLYQLKNNQNQDNQDQEKDDQGEDQKNEKDKQEQKKQDKKNEDKQEEKEHPDPNKMSKENAEQMLQAAMQDEKETQEKVQQAMQQPQRKRLKKQW